MGAIEGMAAVGLGPTLLGLGAIALLGAVPWIVRLVLRSQKPVASGATPEEQAFDADAALARYMERRAAGVEEPAHVDEADDLTPIVRPAFGRKVA